jgi:hypothetical protein
VHFADAERVASPIPLGDLAAAEMATAIPNITMYSGSPGIAGVTANSRVSHLLWRADTTISRATPAIPRESLCFNGSSRAGEGATYESRARTSATNRERAAERAEWEGEKGDEEMYRHDILPGLSTVPLARIMAATGLSLRYCALIRRGERIPHPRFWEALRRLIGEH